MTRAGSNPPLREQSVYVNSLGEQVGHAVGFVGVVGDHGAQEVSDGVGGGDGAAVNKQDRNVALGGLHTDVFRGDERRR